MTAPHAVNAPPHASPGPLVPRRVLFGNPDRSTFRISPDGRRIGFLAPVDGVLEVWVGPADDPSAARPVTSDRKRGIRAWAWTHSGSHLLYMQDEGGDEDWHVYAVDLDHGTTRDLTPLKGVQARIESTSPRRPFEVVVGTNDRDPRYHDLYVVDLRTGVRTLLLENTRFVGFDLDGDFRIHFAMEPMPAGGRRIVRRLADGSWTTYADVGPDDEMTTHVASVTSDGTVAYLADSRGRDTAALVELDLATGATRVLAEDPHADVDDVITDPVTRRVLAVSFQHLRTRWLALDDAVGADLAALAGICGGDAAITGRTLDGRTWSVLFLMDDGPVRYYLYDRTTRTARFVFTNRTALEGLPLAKMRPVIIPARDGLRLPSYLTLPVGEGERPRAPLPLVLYVHGGPWARDVWGFHPVHQWLANRGYAVLSVNYRGSTGFGKSFVNAADREWAGRMHDDLIDAVRWAVDQGIADPARVAISGGSYGGYATLVGLTRTPEVFACGVDVVGPSSVVTLIRSVPAYWIPIVSTFTRRVGNPETPEGFAFLTERSPLTDVAQIRRPLLIAQGANDPRVKQAEADQIVAAMKSHRIPVTYVLFPDEGHGFARPENSLAFHAAEEAFLARHLGGRCEPVGDDFRNSSIRIPEGRDAIAGADVPSNASV